MPLIFLFKERTGEQKSGERSECVFFVYMLSPSNCELKIGLDPFHGIVFYTSESIETIFKKILSKILWGMFPALCM